MRVLIGALAGAVLIMGAGAAKADVLFDSIVPADVGSPSGNALTIDYGTGPLAASFSTGAQGVALTGVNLLLELPSSATGGVSVYLTSSPDATSGGTFASVINALAEIGTIQDTALANGNATVFDLTLSTPIALSPNSQYWIELGSDPSDGKATSLSWIYSTAGSYPNQAMWTYGDGTPSTTTNADAGATFEMSVEAVPEPTALALLAGFIPMVLVARRKRSGSATCPT